MKPRVKKWMAAMALALAAVFLAEVFYAPEVTALEAQPNSILTIYPELVTDDGRVTVGLCLTYQESTGTFTGMNVQHVYMDPSVTYLRIQDYYLSADRKWAYVELIYSFKENGVEYGNSPILYKTVP